MSKSVRRFFSFGLLLVLSLVVLKNLWPEASRTHVSCDEFGHIHWTQVHGPAESKLSGKLPEEGGHSAHSLFGHAVLLSPPVSWAASMPLNDEWIPVPARINEDPVLEPRRRPPRRV